MERRVIMALDDVKAVTFECLNAKCPARVRISVSPDIAQIPKTCPSCGEGWGGRDQSKNFVAALAQLRVLAAQAVEPTPLPFRIHLEFVEDSAVNN